MPLMRAWATSCWSGPGRGGDPGRAGPAPPRVPVRLGALNHPGRRSQRIAEALARGACPCSWKGRGQHRWLSGHAALDVFHQDPAELSRRLADPWCSACRPTVTWTWSAGCPGSDSAGCARWLLVSAFIGANLLVRSALPAGCQATVLSLSSYYAATKVIDETQPLRAPDQGGQAQGLPGFQPAGLPGAGDLAASPGRQRGWRW
ncbi:Uncharacterized protein conserved in bacteria [Pseudomonas aeruginosa]|nr:Uncharacterized protein conserved in bacteria [Pseudomonas aeruginosa]